MSAVLEDRLSPPAQGAAGLSTRALARRRGWLAAVELAAVVCLILLIVWVYVAKAAGATEAQRIAAMEAEMASQSARVRLLRAEVARLENPARLERLARSHLGMTLPRPEQEVGLAELAVRGRGLNPAPGEDRP